MRLVGEGEWTRWYVGGGQSKYTRALKLPGVPLWLLNGRAGELRARARPGKELRAEPRRELTPEERRIEEASGWLRRYHLKHQYVVFTEEEERAVVEVIVAAFGLSEKAAAVLVSRERPEYRQEPPPPASRPRADTARSTLFERRRRIQVALDLRPDARPRRELR